ncbi:MULTISPECIES: pyroglutamyl-peptidase I [unclassified Clostridioides]|uniref:pyroglutamyl-peptidase I n=1 Tax=unclassified Clostridioides TaxID=2635829 RepID=UPI001D10A1ED|nr:pyroglutamyl-peptidase I [Clostridioides sp. ZZV14-6105]MCC0725032.1 pyroglutamyl-peptidase I [Clostridioides sp. ZZV14-6045]MCC0732056.1 pyroglutamyl-peptidase I [Clostridioides sp. ZZV14-6048]MCC0735049.1 pyroglutamyl-peptidase I [Clostridioides sp. ZZV14-6009]WLD27973.1 Pyrrolidone-carboxylate peptidase [Clostridioides difficile]
MKVLLTGFDPFGGEPINPAQEAVERVKDNIKGSEIIKITIPTVMTKSVEAIDKAIQKHNPDIVISVGQAGGRFDITPERVAINVDDFRIKDNEGNQVIDTVIKEDGQPAYFSKLPVKAMAKHMNENKIPASVSNTAGTFVCNHVMYGILYMIDKKYPNIRGGFIHIPYVTSQIIDKKNTPFMSLEEIVKGLELAIEACIIHKDDIKEIGGEIS